MSGKKQQQQKKPAAAKGKGKTNEIDALFGAKKRAKATPAPKEAAEQHDAAAPAPKGKRARTAAAAPAPKKSARGSGPDLDTLMDPNGKMGGRKVVDGLRVFTLDELEVNPNSGGTPLCPFDCDCCH
eukprot:m51a1_g10222 hypothetical protein (127) ;mRNA; f:132821-133290